MWSCIRLNFGGRTKLVPQQLRLFSDAEKIKKLEKKNLAVWSKQINELIRKREMLELIGEYIELQREYVDSRLRSNKKLLQIAKDSCNLNNT